MGSGILSHLLPNFSKCPKRYERYFHLIGQPFHFLCKARFLAIPFYQSLPADESVNNIGPFHQDGTCTISGIVRLSKTELNTYCLVDVFQILTNSYRSKPNCWTLWIGMKQITYGYVGNVSIFTRMPICLKCTKTNSYCSKLNNNWNFCHKGKKMDVAMHSKAVSKFSHRYAPSSHFGSYSGWVSLISQQFISM